MQNIILIVDDEKELLQVMKIKLEDKNYEVHAADNYSLALELFEKYKPNLALVDVSMPEITGFNLCKEFKKKSSRGMKIIIYTGDPDYVNNRMARQAGADDFAVKTGDFQYVLEKIEQNLQ